MTQLAKNKLTILFLAVALALLMNACRLVPSTQSPTPMLGGTYLVDPVFRELYEHLGGMETLGPAISPLSQEGNYKAQYTMSGLMVHDMLAPYSQQYQLAPLGLFLDVAEPAVPAPQDSTARYVDGHVIYNEFIPKYEALGGARFVGRPLTEMRYNPEKQRFEQYFETLGFYRLDTDPPGEIRLLAYGAFICDYQCRYRPDRNSIPTRHGLISEPFATAVSELGPAFVGRAISKEPYLAPDGQLEMIFDNLVLYTDPIELKEVHARPIPQIIGFPPQPLNDPIEDPRMVFYAVEGKKGYNIPLIFSEHIAQHGTLEISGPPITEIFLYRDKVYRQCFTKICLDYHQNAPDDLQIRPAPLGLVYKAQFYYQNNQDFIASQSLKNLTMKVWESRPVLTSAQEQAIYVAIFEDSIPLPNMEPVLTLTLPGDREMEIHFPPTGENGQSVLNLPAVEARNGTMIPYQVCLRNINNDRSCVLESYLIWGNP